MTLMGRNTTIRLVLLACVIVTAGLIALFVAVLTGWGSSVEVDLRVGELFAVGGTFVTVGLGLLYSAIYARLFRRSPSIPVFFVTFFFLSMTLDIFKIGQIVVHSGLWPQYSPTIARVTIFGHISGVFALFAAGLYAGGVRMQRHGTVVLVGAVIALSLSVLIPVDTTTLPDHLVYPAGVRASFEVALLVILGLSVANFIQAAIANQNSRFFLTAAAIALLAMGRELLYYSAEPLAIIVGGGGVILGGAIFTGRHYRDYLVS